MAGISTSATAVSTTAVALNTRVGHPLTIIVDNEGSDEVYLGGSGVTSTTGIRVLANEKFSWDLKPNHVLYAICAAAESATVRVAKDLQ